MRVVIYGSVAPSTGGWCYAQAFTRAGCETRTIDDQVKLGHYRTSLAHRLYRRVVRRVRESDRLAHVEAIISEARRFCPDIFIATGGHQLCNDSIRQLQDLSVWVANVNHDDFFSRYRANWTWTQRRAISAYDYIFSTRMVNVNEIRNINPNVVFFPFSYDPAVHRKVPIPPAERDLWEVDVVFVGQWAEHRSSVIDQLVRAVPAKYAIHGPGWDRLPARSPVRQFIHPTHVWGDDMAKALGGAKIALGFLRKENRDDYTQRTFEIPACGGLLLAERTPMHCSLFEEGTEAEFFDADQPSELIGKVKSLLADNVRREAIRAAGTAAVSRGEHTYDHRIRQVLDLYEGRIRLP